MKFRDLRANKLCGPIPDSIGNLTNLTILFNFIIHFCLNISYYSFIM